jgi:phosphohistidine swiveling domain-containing protein
MPIPGGNSISQGWSLDKYVDLVKAKLGKDTVIVSTAHESEMVPLLRKALGLP